jgi:4-amino-4-deoxychorismate lyase
MIRASILQIGIDDRGFNYGDGLFETLLVAEGEPVWWDAHYARLQRGCEVLRIACPGSDVLLAQARVLVQAVPDEQVGLSVPVRDERGGFSNPVQDEQVGFSTGAAMRDAARSSKTDAAMRDAARSPRADAAMPDSTLSPRADPRQRTVLKLVLTRGAGGRGYAPPRAAVPNLVWSLHEAPVLQREGIAVRWCELRLSQQPVFAGLKHLNRLENVLARAEWDDPGIAEGLLLDAAGRVVGATTANLFVARGGKLLTPRVHRCGIAGVARAWVMRRMLVEETDLDVHQIESADELFLTNSLRGILPVARLGGREWNIGPMTRRLQELLHDEVPAL